MWNQASKVQPMWDSTAWFTGNSFLQDLPSSPLGWALFLRCATYHLQVRVERRQQWNAPTLIALGLLRLLFGSSFIRFFSFRPTCWFLFSKVQLKVVFAKKKGNCMASRSPGPQKNKKRWRTQVSVVLGLYEHADRRLRLCSRHKRHDKMIDEHSTLLCVNAHHQTLSL